MRQDYLGHPLPFSKDPGTEGRPRLSWGEYLASAGPIPLSGPIGYIYDELQKVGMSKTESVGFIKALIYEGMTVGGAAVVDPMFYTTLGLGLPGFHIAPTHPPKEKPMPTTPQGIRNRMMKDAGIQRPKTRQQLLKELLKEQH